jgi:hypothetical protein
MAYPVKARIGLEQEGSNSAIPMVRVLGTKDCDFGVGLQACSSLFYLSLSQWFLRSREISWTYV